MKENPYKPPDSPAKPAVDVRPRIQWLLSTHWVLATIQIVQTVVQCIEIAFYESQISDYMPTMAEPDKTNWIQWQFETFAIATPAISQFVLLPALMFLSINRSCSNRWKTTFCVIAICLTLFIWYNSFVAAIYTIKTFD